MRTLKALATATAANAADMLKLATDRGWPTDSIKRHASRAVLALLGAAPEPTAPRQKRKARQQVAKYQATPKAPKAQATPTAVKQPTPGKALAVIHCVAMQEGMLTLWITLTVYGARPYRTKRPGFTHDVLLRQEGFPNVLRTMSPRHFEQLTNGEPVRMWLDDAPGAKAWVVKRTRAE